jgi:heme-degrading monooxygenase HmoA
MEGDTVQVILIDLFIVPDESKSELLDKARWSAGLLKTIPGYVEGFIYEKTGGDSPYDIVTTAVWESESAFENARKAAFEMFQKVGFDPQEIMRKLGVGFKRAVYSRATY